MTFHGHIQNGMIVPREPIALPEGTEVQFSLVAPASVAPAQGRTLTERLAPVLGTVDGLPEDAARNLKHYLYGHPKQ